jgi:aryl-alcohol dehydrogenase-like predicted oxidoreductase
MHEPIRDDRITLGATGIEIPPLGFGCWAWGDRWVWGYGSGGYSDDDLREAYEVSVAAGVDFFDTAEIYGLGRSETLLGEFARADTAPIVTATKFVPYPWRLNGASLLRALRASLKRLGLARVDLYQIHVPLPPVPVQVWMHAMAEAVELGLTRAVGVSNYSFSQMGQAHNALQDRGLVLASNQVHYSLLHRDPETDGVLKLCRDLNVTLLAYSPLEMGILTGKYTPDNRPTGSRRHRYPPRYLRRVQPLIERMHEIGDAHGGKSPAQVALNWTICKGTVPIPGAKNARQAASNLQALGWRLTEDEMSELEELAGGV